MGNTYGALHLYSGCGGGARGFQDAVSEYKGARGRFYTLAGIDCDEEANQDFENLTGVPATNLDLFSRSDFEAWHGKEPPDWWKEAIPEDIKNACGGISPDIVFASPPCKGFSGLLPSKSAKSRKYQALNNLTIRGIFLTLEAFRDNLPGFFLLENVPRIKTRGKDLINTITGLLKSYGYAVTYADHDCGEIGGLGQIRKRFLLIARNPEKVPAFVYEPGKLPHRTIGEVIGPLPLPGDAAGGPMHRLPRLQWKTWVRLALIPAGGDWRDLENIDYKKYKLEHAPRAGVYQVADWDRPGKTIVGNARVGGSNGMAAVNDPRLPDREGRHPGVYKVVKFDEPGPCITGTRFGSGAPAVSDPRFGFKEGTHRSIYRVSSWDEAGPTVTGAHRPNNGAIVIGDPRLNCRPRNGAYGVQQWNEPAKTVIGAGDIHAGSSAISDPRIPADTESGTWVIIAEDGTWHRPLTTYELAMLQGFPRHLPDGKPFHLTGNSDARWRERIGNAVPVPAAKAIAKMILISLLASAKNECAMGFAPIWVRPETVIIPNEARE